MKFRKKPIVIEAMKYYSGEEDKIIYWAHSELHPSTNSIITKDYGPTLKIRTLEGYINASPGDWIIKGIQNEFYPCKPDIFEKTYEEVK